MKKQVLFFFLFFLSSTVLPIIIESDQISEIQKHLIHDKKSLVIFDLDNVIGAVDSYIGTDQWFYHMVNKHTDSGLTSEQAVCHVLPTYCSIQFSIPLALIEKDTPKFIKKLQEKKIPTICLTTRSYYLADRTLEQLNGVGISFLKNNLEKTISFTLPAPCLYKNGILFSGRNNKGDVLLTFLKSLNISPDKVIFIDDKLKNLEVVENALKTRKIDFVGIRYSKCDELVKNFEPKKAHKCYQDFLKQRSSNR
jgi:hypothetical protein